MIAMFRSQDPTAVEASVSWASFDPVPRWLDHARELSEHWLHRQQLRDALGRRDDHDAEVLGAVLDALRWAWPHGLRDVGTPGDAATVRIHGTSEATWHLQRQADGWAFTDDPAVTPALTADLDAEDAWRLLSNNDRRDRLAVDGRPELVRAFARSRAIIGRPQ